MRLVSRLNDTRDQSQLTLKLSLLLTTHRAPKHSRNTKKKKTGRNQDKENKNIIYCFLIRPVFVCLCEPALDTVKWEKRVIPKDTLPKRFDYLVHA